MSNRERTPVVRREAEARERSVPTQGPAAGSAVDPAADPAAAAAVDADPRGWRERLAEGRFEQAQRQRLIAVGSGAEPDDGDEGAAVRALVDLQGLLRDKRWKRARRMLTELDARPPLLDWPRLEGELDQVVRAGAALERREVDEALTALQEPPQAAAGSAADAGEASGVNVDPSPAAASPAEDRLLLAEHETLLGTALIMDGRGDQAEEAFERALERDPKHHRALVNLGNVALEDGRTDRAIELYEAALALDDGFANAHHNLGVAYRRKGQIGRSVRALRRAQKADRSRERSEAQESMRGLRDSLRARRMRWLLWASVAALVVWLLMTRG